MKDSGVELLGLSVDTKWFNDIVLTLFMLQETKMLGCHNDFKFIRGGIILDVCIVTHSWVGSIIEQVIPAIIRQMFSGYKQRYFHEVVNGTV